MKKRLLLGLAPMMALTAAVAVAQVTPTVRVRGTIEKVDGDVLTVHSREGDTLTIHLTPDYTVGTVIKASLADIKEGSFVGTSAVPQKDGTLKALEVHIFPESQRGTGEGFKPWDLTPDSTMTNATVTSSVNSVDGRTLMLTYKGGQKKVVIPPNVPIVMNAPAQRSDVVAGAPVSIGNARKMPDGTLQASRITVGKDGVAPPS
ncbi:MAG TPA: hypothetical protein VG271_02090 [Beijerinckiaceae bacterium]|jgi:hypothetical protein|nr:hypothetical protein [Beijerinckiaceae bacterium]